MVGRFGQVIGRGIRSGPGFQVRSPGHLCDLHNFPHDIEASRSIKMGIYVHKTVVVVPLLIDPPVTSFVAKYVPVRPFIVTGKQIGRAHV